MTYQCPACGRPLDSLLPDYRPSLDGRKMMRTLAEDERRREHRRAWEREYRRRRYHSEPEVRARILARVRRYEQARRAG